MSDLGNLGTQIVDLCDIANRSLKAIKRLLHSPFVTTSGVRLLWLQQGRLGMQSHVDTP